MAARRAATTVCGRSPSDLPSCSMRWGWRVGGRRIRGESVAPKAPDAHFMRDPSPFTGGFMNLQTGIIAGLALLLVILVISRGKSKKSGPGGPPMGGPQP